ncbi:MAG: MDR family oxidoreductase [Bryobacterales bacterium]|nr:MDR family oxidoreductase [Bryobacterales bacterium]
MSDPFRALVVNRVGDQFESGIRMLPLSALPDQPVLVRVSYSSLNYKDGLAVTDSGKIVRRFPMVPGIDLAGVVEESADARFRAGDAVLATGCGIGEEHWGGYAAFARLRPEWMVPMPEGLDARRAMALGTAGFTAMLCVEALERHDVRPESGEVLVTGASGGVGSVAVMLLAKLGYTVVAVSGKADVARDLTKFGAAEVLPREALSEAGKPLESARWAGVVDSVGGSTLVRALAQTKLYGCVAACGNAGGASLNATVFPFILRGVTLAGISSVNQPLKNRLRLWPRLSGLIPMDHLEAITGEINLNQVHDYAGRILRGEIRGRTVVKVEE